MGFKTTSEPPLSGAPGSFADPLKPIGTPQQAGTLPIAEGTGGNEPTEENTPPPALEIAGGWSEAQWLESAQRSYGASTTWFEASVQASATRNYAHFQSRHAPGSKYLHDYYRLRSQTFRPKTRAMVRRSEASAVVALFSTSDLLDTDAYDDTNPDQQDASEVAKAILQYRLERSLFWYQTVAGAQQDASVTGRPIFHIYWRYRTRARNALQQGAPGADGTPGRVEQITEREVIEDKPRIDLVPLENLRIDPAADWRDPINSSPTLFHRIPMYVGDLKAMARDENAQFGNAWYRDLSDGTWWSHIAGSNTDASGVRMARNSGQLDPSDMQRGVPDFEVVWVTRCYMRKDNVDYVFDMLDKDLLLSTPREVEDVYPHLEPLHRPYAMGTSAVEAHKVYPTSPVGMVEESQREVNELANLTQDGLRMAVLNRWIARRGANIDVETLKYAAANSVIIADDISKDVRELRQSDVPQSAFAQTDRVSASFDEVAGNFSSASVATNRELNETVGGMNLLSGDASQVKEYEIRTLVETLIEPCLNQLYSMEQYYETDEGLLRDVATRAGLDLGRVVDVLALGIRVRTNVGFNSTSPERRIQRIALCVSTVTQLSPETQQGLNGPELVKEIFGAAGFKNGARFYPTLEGKAKDPMVQQLQQENAQLKSMLAGKQMEVQGKLKAAQITVQGRLQQAAMQNASREKIAAAENALRAQELQLQSIDRQLAGSGQELDRLRLANERDALSNEIQNSRIELLTMLAPHAVGRIPIEHEQGPVNPGDALPSMGASTAASDGQAGTLSRGDFGLIPFQPG